MVVAGGLGATLILASRELGREALPFEQVVHYQLDKLERSVPDTVFLGDSSLGNAISAERWSELRGETAANLALTGSYGYVGAYNLLQRVVARGTPKNVVIMFNIGVLRRGESTVDIANNLTAPPGALSFWQKATSSWRIYINTDQFIDSMQWLRHSTFAVFGLSKPENHGSDTTILEDDYIKQGKAREPVKYVGGYQPSSLDFAHLEYLHKIAEICARYQINCVYAHGPLFHRMCSSSEKYISRAFEAVKGSALPIATDRPFCFADDELGDTFNHVKPGLKPTYTERYLTLLSPYLSAPR